MSEARPTARERAAARSARKRHEMEEAIADGRLTIRQMTPTEHTEARRLRTIRADEREKRKAMRATRA